MLRSEFKMADISLLPRDVFEDSEDDKENSDTSLEDWRIGGWSGGSGDCDSASFHQDEDTLSPCARLDKYALSENILYRQMVPSILLEILRDASPEALTADLPGLMETLSRVADDSETAIRTDLVQRIPHLATACCEYSTRVPALSAVNVDHLLPMIVRYLGDADSQVRKATYASLLQVMEQALVPKEAIEQQVCPKVLQFSHAESLMDYQTGAVQLMSKMVPLLGRETTERLFLKRFSELCSNPMFYIRKICASSFGEFCAVVGSEAYENVLLPCFIELCTDDVWGVRKSCAEVIMTVSCACSPQSRKTTLATAFGRLLQDQSRWVRMSAYQTLGPFISTFADPSIIGLTYNNLGELVLINPEGTEFRINSPAFTDANLKAAADFRQHFYQAQEGIIGRNTKFGYVSKYDLRYGDDKQSSDNLENNMENEETNENETKVESGETIESKIEEAPKVDILVKCIKVQLENEETSQDGDSSEIKPLLEKISFLDLGSDSQKSDNKDNNEEDLNKFNSFNYWNINPDIEIDPDFVNSCKTSKADDSASEKFRERLDGLNFSNSLNDDTIEWKILPTDDTIQNDDSFTDSDASCDTDSLEVNISFGSELTKEEQKENQTQEIVPQMLIDHFISMTDAELAGITDNDMAYHCAFSLPAVALTLGRNNWHLLKKTCEILAADMQYKVRKTIASSLHELALILGQDLAGEHLVPIFDGFIKDLDEVRIGVLKHLAHFLKLIGPDKRNLYLPRLCEFLQTDNEWNWRFREELAKQLLKAVPLYQAADASKHIVMLAQELLCDKVFAVRRVALALVTELVRHMSGDPNLTTWLLIKLAEEFAHSKRWVRRQAFALLCSCLISSGALPPEKFAQEVMPHLLDLSWDPVPNVRLAVSRTIARNIIVHEYFMEEQQESLQTVLRRMQSDKDRDVRHYALLTTYQ